MRWLFLILAAYAADTVDLAEVNYALRLAPKYLRGEKPGHPKVPCIVTKEMAESLSRAQDKLRLTELFVRVLECGNGYVEVRLEDRSGLTPRKPEITLDAAMRAEGWRQDLSRPQRYLR